MKCSASYKKGICTRYITRAQYGKWYSVHVLHVLVDGRVSGVILLIMSRGPVVLVVGEPEAATGVEAVGSEAAGETETDRPQLEPDASAKVPGGLGKALVGCVDWPEQRKALVT